MTDQSKGNISVCQEYDPALRRHTMRAQLHPYEQCSHSHQHRVDCEITWISEDRFEFSGLQVLAEHVTEYIIRDGWLCGYHIYEVELTKAPYAQMTVKSVSYH
jgi:hypothetical protein